MPIHVMPERTQPASQSTSQSGIPSGVIVMWHGALATIPTGWYLCDGTNGTPDLRSKFIVGAADGVEPGNTGGSATHSHDSHAALSHSGASVADHAAMTHSGTAVDAHSGAAVADHAALSHNGTAVSSHAGCSVANHTSVATKQGTASGNVVTTNTHTVTQASDHTVTQPAQHAAQTHTVTQPSAHTVTQPAQHAAQAHTVTQPDQHSAQSHSSASNLPPYFEAAYIMKG